MSALAVADRGPIELDRVRPAMDGPARLDGPGPDVLGADVPGPDVLGADVPGPDVLGADSPGDDVLAEVITAMARLTAPAVEPAVAGEQAVAFEPEVGEAIAAEIDPESEPLPAQTVIESLVAGSVSGDRSARERLLTEIHPLVLRYCRARLGRQETVIGSADDVAQEVCLAVVSALPNYTIKGLSFRAFVYGIAAHKVTDAFRAIGRNRSEPMADLPDTPALHDGPEQRLLAGELAERLGHLLHRLTPRQREILVLRIAVGLSAEETAQVVGSTPGAVRVTQHRALNRLRGVVAPCDDCDGGRDEL